MTASKRSSGGKGQQPEALNTFHAAARSGSEKPKDQGLAANPGTAPKPKSLGGKNKAAAEVLEAGAKGRPRTSKAAKEASNR
jgi:hypothetical protein